MPSRSAAESTEPVKVQIVRNVDLNVESDMELGDMRGKVSLILICLPGIVLTMKYEGSEEFELGMNVTFNMADVFRLCSHPVCISLLLISLDRTMCY